MISPTKAATKRHGPNFVEIVGLAGAGKSTLTNTLCKSGKRVVVADRFRPTALRNMPFSVSYLLCSLPPLVLRGRIRRPMTRSELKRMISLKGWQRVLRRQASVNDAAIVLDQGPVFKLANLHGFGPEWLKRESLSDWWDHMFKQWAAVLDIIIWLDAPRDILVQRIHARRTWHAVKEKSGDEVTDFLSTYQLSCEHVVSNLVARRPIQVIRFDTSRRSPRQIAGDVLAALTLSSAK